MKKRVATITFSLCVFLAPLLIASGKETLPPGSKPLSTILKSVERQSLGVISEVEFDDGLWEVTVCNASGCLELYIDPVSGEERRRGKDDDVRLPPANAKPLSAIVELLEQRNVGSIREIQFDDGMWEVEISMNGREVEMKINPVTGEEIK